MLLHPLNRHIREHPLRACLAITPYRPAGEGATSPEAISATIPAVAHPIRSRTNPRTTRIADAVLTATIVTRIDILIRRELRTAIRLIQVDAVAPAVLVTLTVINTLKTHQGADFRLMLPIAVRVFQLPASLPPALLPRMTILTVTIRHQMGTAVAVALLELILVITLHAVDTAMIQIRPDLSIAATATYPVQPKAQAAPIPAHLPTLHAIPGMPRRRDPCQQNLQQDTKSCNRSVPLEVNQNRRMKFTTKSRNVSRKRITVAALCRVIRAALSAPLKLLAPLALELLLR